MFEVIRDTLTWAMSWVLDRRPHGDEAFRLLFLIAITLAVIFLVVSWRTLAHRSPALRRRLRPEERYAGRYLQALWYNGEVRYSLISIFYNKKRCRYEATGRTYHSSGKLLADFQSPLVTVLGEKEPAIEFVWRTGTASQGYTKMVLEDVNEDYIQGDGQVITFDAWPRAYPMRFKHLLDEPVREALGVPAPRKAGEEPDFIRKFHATFGAQVMDGFGGARKTYGKAPSTSLVLHR